MTEPSSPASVVRDLVAAGDRRRRQRAVAKALSRAVPAAAAGVFLAGMVASALGWSAAVTAALWIVAAAVLAGWAALRTRARPTSDALAAAVDEDAGLGGELRSAHWFSSHPSSSPWAEFHVAEAARRAAGVPWHDVYPRTHARGAWLAAAVLTAAAFAVPVGLPAGRWLPVSVPTGAEELVDLSAFDELSPELRDKLLELLAAVSERKMTPLEALAELRELTDFAKMDQAMKDQIAQLLDDALTNRERFEKTKPGSPADAANENMTRDTEWARENMASRLANEEAQKAAEDAARGGESEETESKEPGPTTDQSAEGEAGEASEGQPSAKVPAKPSESADGAAVMMLGNSDSAIGEPGSVFGGKRGNVRYGTTQAADLAASLKKETIEAVVNMDRSDLENDDRRRKTEQSWSSLSYTRGGARAAFDREKTGAVRAVPEARKPVVERYFVRPATPEEQTPR